MVNDLGLDINYQDDQGNSPTHSYARSLPKNSGEYQKIAFIALQKYGANFNIANNEGCTPLHIACLQHNLVAIKLLFSDNTVRAMCKDSINGDTAFHYLLKNYIPERRCGRELAEYENELLKIIIDFLESYPLSIFATNDNGKGIIDLAFEMEVNYKEKWRNIEGRQLPEDEEDPFYVAAECLFEAVLVQLTNHYEETRQNMFEYFGEYVSMD